jgi:lactam utilization protein B
MSEVVNFGRRGTLSAFSPFKGYLVSLLKLFVMITAEIKPPEKDADMILKVISKLGGKVKLIQAGSPKLSSAAKKMKMDLENAFKDVKLHQQGKIQLKTARELLDEL